MASFVFLKAKAKFAKGQIDWTNDVLRAIPLDTVPDQTTDEFVSDISGDEIGSVRETLQNAAVTENATTNDAELDSDDWDFLSVPSGSTMRGWVIYKQVGGDDTTPGDDDLIAWIDHDDIATDGRTVSVQLAPNGAINL